MKRINNKKLNNKGFSLIELMGALVILAIITVVTVVAVARFIDKSKQQKIVQNKKNVAVAAELYLQANRDLVPKVIGDSTKVMLSELRKHNYIKEDVTNAKNESCMKESFVYVTKLSENDYSYVTKLYCGDEHPGEEQPVAMPYLLDLENPQGGTGKIVFSNASDVKKANFSFTIKGGENDDGEDVGIYSYSYTILAKTGYDNDYTELYNSGVIDAKKAPKVEFKSRALGTYVDLAGVTKVKVRVTALNEDGGYLTYDQTNGEETSGSGQYEDTDKPICPAVDDYPARLGEPQSLDDWVSKKDMGSSKYPRIVTLKCEDGDGSGCKRESFSEAWPNINKYPYGIMFGNITLEDNAVINENGEKKPSPNTQNCPINVFVDLKAPTVKLKIINPAPAEGNPSLVSTGVVYNGKKFKDGETIVVNDVSDPVNNKSVPTQLTINSINYLNNAHPVSKDRGWLNKKNYSQGVEFEIEASDNIYLYDISWKVNLPNHGLDTSNLNNVYESGQYVYQENDLFKLESEGKHWVRTADPSDPLYLNEEEIYRNKVELNDSQNTKKFTFNLFFDGARHGVLTVKDRAGNETTIDIYANLDKHAPPLDASINSPLQMPVPYNDNEDEDAAEIQNMLRKKNGYENRDDELGWSDGYDIDRRLYPDGRIPSMVDNSTVEEGYNWSNVRPGGWGGGGGYGGYDDDYEEDDSPITATKPYCPSVEDTGVHGILRGESYDPEKVIERHKTGCYKVGVRDGDNDIKDTIGEIDFHDTETFRDLVRSGKEYKSGQWSREELACGPKKEETYDNIVTLLTKDGTITEGVNPNKIMTEDGEEGEEISGWGSMEILYFKQIGIQLSEDKTYLEPMYNPNPEASDNQRTIINIRDRSQWPVYRDQGTHRLYWTNCDEAENCTEDYTVQENIRIDTIAPQCKNKVTFDDNLNSDGELGPNHNGWLYDQQTATVSHDCADSSILSKNTFDKAFKSVNRINESGFNKNTYHEYGSGCAEDPDKKFTDETYVYSDDIYTCLAGTRGVGAGYMGVVQDVAGNTRECLEGATIRKDTTPPACKTAALYKGINSQGTLDAPNTHGWAWGSQKIQTKKDCTDAMSKFKNYETPGCTGSYHGYKGTDCAPMSGCSAKDDYENEVVTRVPSTYYKILKRTDTLETTFDYGKGYEVFYPNNNSRFTLEDYDVDADFGTSEPIIENGEIVFKDGYVVDRAGNISGSRCEPVWVRRDSNPPNCTNEVKSPNIYFTMYNSRDADTPWQDDVGSDGKLLDKPYKLWFGSNGLDGKEEYAKVIKGCHDNEVINYGGLIKKPQFVSSGCEFYEDPENWVWYYGQKEDQETRISTVGKGKIKTFPYATYMGPKNNDTPIACVEEVEDDAGNKGTGRAKPIEVNIDYSAPSCGEIKIVQGNDSNGGVKFNEYCDGENAKFQRYCTQRTTKAYNFKLTKKALGAYVDCKNDTGSGCLYGNGIVISGGVTKKSYKTIDYKGRSGTEQVDLYAFDKARNTKICHTTFSIQQDRVKPVGQCTYKASYSVDEAADSYVEIKTDKSTFYDPLGEPDNYASGLDLENSYINLGFNLYYEDTDSNYYYKYYYYFDEIDSTFRFGSSEYGSWGSLIYTDKYGNKFERTKWQSFLPWNIRLDQSYKKSANDFAQVNNDGTVTIRKPLVCSKQRRKPRPMLHLFDKAGNKVEKPCTPETPEDEIIVPACCDQAEGDKWECDDWVTTECDRYCNGGHQHDERTCRGVSKYKKDKKSPEAQCVKPEKTKDVACNTQKCCSETVKECSEPTTSSTFGSENPCSFQQRRCINYSAFTPDTLPDDYRAHCSRPFYETVMVDEETCKSEIRKANEEGEEAILRDLVVEYYDSKQKELYYTNPETGYKAKYEPVVQDGYAIPFEYIAIDDYGLEHRYCDEESARKFIKADIDEEISDPCARLQEDIFEVDEDGNIYSYVRVYNYIASPLSCNLYMDSNPTQDWILFKSIDPENCKIDSDKIKPNESNCWELYVDDTTLRSYVSRDGEFELGGKIEGCNINVSWISPSKYNFASPQSSKYRDQNYVAVRCPHKDSAVVEYCMESCDSGVCIFQDQQ